MGKLFGTDGIRGVAGEPPLDERTVFAVGRAVGEFLQKGKSRSLTPSPGRRASRFGMTGGELRVLLGEDTRESSGWMTGWLAGGLRAAGVEAVSAGVLPTPAVARLVQAKGFAAGLMVSASHNPYRDNGIKLIGANGMKLPDDLEAEIEERIHNLVASDGGEAHPPQVDSALVKAYLELLRGAAPSDLTGRKLVVDCANGAAVRTAPALLASLGATVTAIHASPDGKNINEGCGALHPESLQATVRELGADLGVAFDGDADRAIFVSASGRRVDGDGVLLAAARWMKEKGALKGGAVVGTVMANLGLEVALKRAGIGFVRAAVGDRYVLEEMLRRGANLGGEQSGHIIFLDDSPTGDGLLTALKVLSILREKKVGLDELVADLKVFPQRLENIRVREKVPLEKLPAVQAAIREAEAALGDRGRVVVRYSGTEKLLRVMIEAETEADVTRWVGHISHAVASSLGA
ncbi:MAG TPA: phosphoglucosamine mutase [Candidatus Xenobia bacterium]|nr:phosphoglucosamine mutase [Candidatus Xenobia bacterium]